MLPLVLGGIALATVGYGVKEYCESEGCPWDAPPERKPDAPVNVFETLHQMKKEIYEEKLLKLSVLLSQFKSVDEKFKLTDIVLINEEKLSLHEIEDDVKLYAHMYIGVLKTSANLLDVYVTTLETLLTKEVHYNRLDKSEKKCIKKAYKTANTIQKLLGLRLLNDNVLNVEVIPTLKQLKSKIDSLDMSKNI